MKNKIDEIMVLVDDLIGCDSASYQFDCKRAIEAKLRELVFAPKNGMQLAAIGLKHFGNPIPQEWYAAARELEESHKITQSKTQD